MRTWHGVLLIAALALASGTGALADAVVGQRAPDARFVTVDGSRFNLSAYRGTKAVVLLFTRGSNGEFACYYCGQQTHEYKAAYERVKAAGAEVLMVLPGPSTIQGYLQKVGENGDPPESGFSVPFPVVTDPDFSACRAFGVPYSADSAGPMWVSQPATVVIGKDGTVLYAYHGTKPADRPSVDTVLGVLRGAKAEAPVAKPEAPPAPRPTLAWRTYEEGSKASRTEQRPMLLEFYADWCGNCKQMDALVYSDDRVRASSTAFACVRVEYDQRADLVKQFGIGNGLPVLVLLDANGRELSRLVGFSSVGKVLAACRAALDRIAGKEPAEPAAGARPVPRAVPVTPETLASARGRALAFIRSAWPRAMATSPGLGPDDLVLYTLAASGAGVGDPDVARLLPRVLATPLAGTYQAALRALALARLDPKGQRAALQACEAYLQRTQLENGQWSYGSEAGTALPKTGDNSNGTFALLGLAACRSAGIEMPRALVEKAEGWWHRAQNLDGGWGYRPDRETESYSSMTENGLSSLLLCAKVLGRPAPDPAIEKARGWLLAHWSVEENAKSAYQQGRVLYHLYALERVGSLLGQERLGDHDWGREGDARLLSTQADDGSWDDGSETYLSNTCFGLLFLLRPTGSLR